MKAKSCVRNENSLSRFFSSNIGVRQGENLSPVLFALFVNDLKDYIKSNINGLSHIVGLADHLNFVDLESYIELFILLYADDTVILAESEKDMQAALNSLSVYCTNNKLKINVSKTKVIVFSRGKIRNLPKFTVNNEQVDIAWEYKYLGILFN